MIVSVFKNIRNTTEPIHIEAVAIFKRIKEGSSKVLIEKIRKEEDEDKQSELKGKLPSICFSGKFSKRLAECLLEHSGLICLDIDEIKPRDMAKIFKIIKGSDYTFACFISPRNSGFKIIVKIPAKREDHKALFLALEKHFNPLLAEFISLKKNEKIVDKKPVKIDESQGDFLRVCIDKSGKDVGRVCYESHDPKLYYNEDSNTWIEIQEEVTTEVKIQDANAVISNLQVWIDKKEHYGKGSRNSFLCTFAYASCRYGVPEQTMKDYLESRYPDFPAGELKSVLRSCYKAEDFASVEFTAQELEIRNSVVDVVETKQVTNFWRVLDSGRVKIHTKRFLNFIEAYGYGIYRQKDDVKTWDFVLIKNMIVDIVDIIDIKKDVLSYVDKHAPGAVFDELQMKNRYFEKSFLNALKIVDVQQIKDQSDKSFIFFDGFYYEITATTKKRCDYIDLEGVHIWRSQLCKETITEIVENTDDHDFDSFVYRAMADDDRYLSACTALGYGIHTYKKQRLAKLIYACDASESELDGLMAGGSGKNLWQKALSYVRSVVEIDGKDFDKRDKFKFQTIRDDTQIVIIDDYESDVKELFTKITGGFAVEKKALHKKVIGFEESPKLFVSSNQAPKGFSDSYARRLHILEFSNHYNHLHTPSDDFGDKDFFSEDWNQHDYNCLYSFLFNCVQLYLRDGIKDLEYTNLKTKQLIKNVGRDFAEYWEDKDAPDLGDWQNGRQMREGYEMVIQGEITDQSFYSKLRKLCKIHNWKYESTGVGANRKIRVTK